MKEQEQLKPGDKVIKNEKLGHQPNLMGGVEVLVLV
jgi:hypothetical protein